MNPEKNFMISVSRQWIIYYIILRKWFRQIPGAERISMNAPAIMALLTCIHAGLMERMALMMML
jgi:hypothetical protein